MECNILAAAHSIFHHGIRTSIRPAPGLLPGDLEKDMRAKGFVREKNPERSRYPLLFAIGGMAASIARAVRAVFAANAWKAKADFQLVSMPRSRNCLAQFGLGSRRRSMLMPRGKRPSTAALTSAGARN